MDGRCRSWFILLMLMEEEFDIEIPEEKAEALRTVGDAFAFISAQTAAG